MYRAANVFLLIALDAGCDDIRLATGLDLLSYEVPPTIDAFVLEQIGLDRLLSWGTLFEGRNIEIPEEGQGQGPWDGSCGHDQRVRSGSRGSQSGALFDTESVLFVDHDDT